MNNKVSFPNVTRSYQALSFLLMMMLSLAGFAQGDNPLAPPEDDFLPVETAYIVTPELSGNNVTFTWKVEDAYYLYKHRLGLQLNTPKGKSNLDFSIPDGIIKFDKVFNQDFEVYYGSLELSATLTDALSENDELILKSQGCADAGLCYAPRTQYFSIQNGVFTETDASTVTDIQSQSATTNEIAANTSTEAPEEESELTLLSVLIGAIFGGMILNLMPCVFPVLSLKALTLASGDQSKHRAHGWAYTGGVVVSFAGVAAVLLVAKLFFGTSLGFGFQLQQPAFVAAMVYLFFLLGMNMFGMFEVGTSFMGVGQNLTQGSGMSASFFTGVLAAVVASPCTAPFMATAIGFTLTQGPLVTLIVFITIGFGMALPYLALSHSHALASKLPSPGPWMDVFKQFLAFPLLFTCVWLLVVLGNQTSAYASALIVAGTICLAFALWLLKHQPSSWLKWVVRLAAITLTITAGKIALDMSEYAENRADSVISGQWIKFDEDELKKLNAAGKPVFVDFTADWCITCKLNERVALTDDVFAFAADNNIIMMKADWTSSDPKITKVLNSFGRNGVPLYLVYPSKSGAKPESLPQILSESIVLDALKLAVE